MIRQVSSRAVIGAAGLLLSSVMSVSAQDISATVLERANAGEDVRVIVRLAAPCDPLRAVSEGADGPTRIAVAKAQNDFVSALDNIKVVEDRIAAKGQRYFREL